MKLACMMMLILAIAGIYRVEAQTNFTLKSSKASVQGTSSLHDWESEIIQMACKGSFLIKSNALQSVKDVEIKIPVTGIKSKEGRTMDNKTYKASKSDKNPFIIYSLTLAQVINDDHQDATIEASGNLKMAGSTQPVMLTVKSKLLANGDLQLSVSKKIKMTSYKIKPPTALFGTIKVGNELTVIFDLVMTPSSSNQPQ